MKVPPDPEKTSENRGPAANAESIFLGFVERDVVDVQAFERLCSEHPAFAQELRVLWQDWEWLAQQRQGQKADEKRKPPRTWSQADPGISLDPDAKGEAASFSDDVFKRLTAHSSSSRYHIRSEIARGGMGVILKAWDADLRRSVAMKVILRREKEGAQRDSSFNSLMLSRFIEEAQITGQLDHPGIVPVHELGVDAEGNSFFTMRLLREGRTLEDIFRAVREGSSEWTRERALDVLMRVCEAMAFAHSRGVLHRDLKPSNVMVGRFGETYVVDWGLAKVKGRESAKDVRPVSSALRTPTRIQSDRKDEIDTNPDSPLVTQDGTVLGTPTYMPPEQADMYEDRMCPASDVYSVGAMLYHLMTGLRPYEVPGESLRPYTVLGKLILGPPEPVTRLAPGAPPELVAICDKAMQREPADRYTDMGEMSADLRAFLEHRAVRAYRSGALIELNKWVRRNRALAAASAALVLALVIGLGTSLHLRGLEREARQEAETNLAYVAATDSFLRELLSAPNPWGDGRDVKVVDILDRARARLEGSFEGTAETEAALRTVLAESYVELGLFAEARELIESALVMRRERWGDDHPETLDAMVILLGILSDLDEEVEALARGEETVQLCRRALGEGHPTTLAAMARYAYALVEGDRMSAGEELYREALRLAQEELGDRHPATLTAMGGLADCLQRSSELEEAEELFLRSIAGFREVFGPDDPRVYTYMRGLASLLEARGNQGEAREVLEAALEQRRERLGSDHPGTLGMENDLALLVLNRGQLEEAEAMFRRVQAVASDRLGARHEQTLQAEQNLAWTLQEQGRLTEAEALYRKVLDKRREAGSAGTVEAAYVMNNFAQLLADTNRPAESHALLTKAASIRTETLGADHPQSLASQSDLAGVLEREGRLEEAEKIRRSVLEGFERKLGDIADDTLIARNNLGFLLRIRGRLAEAKAELALALETRRRVSGDAHPSTLVVMSNLAGVLSDLDELDEAEALLRELVEHLRKEHGDFHDRPLWFMGVWGEVLRRQGRLEEAEEVQAEALDLVIEGYGATHLYVSRSSHFLACVYLEQGRFEEAAPLFADAFELRLRDMGPESGDTLSSKGSLGACLISLQRFDEAEGLLLETHASLKRTLGADHEGTKSCVVQILRLYETWGKPEAHRKWEQEPH